MKINEMVTEWSQPGFGFQRPIPGVTTKDAKYLQRVERVNGFEPSTYTLARYRSSQLSYTRTKETFVLRAGPTGVKRRLK